MGFYVHIYMSFPICSQTGKPFYYGSNFTKIYDLSTVDIVPKEFQRFTYEQGNKHLQLYMRDNHYTDSAEAVVDAFPSWDDVESCLSDEAKLYWTKEDHNLFHQAMKWFASSTKSSYTIHWG